MMRTGERCKRGINKGGGRGMEEVEMMMIGEKVEGGGEEHAGRGEEPD